MRESKKKKEKKSNTHTTKEGGIFGFARRGILGRPATNQKYKKIIMKMKMKMKMKIVVLNKKPKLKPKKLTTYNGNLVF